MTNSPPPKRDATARRLLSDVAAVAGELAANDKRRQDILAERGEKSLAALKHPGIRYEDIAEATALSKVGVYKMLAKANGGKLTS